MQKEAQNIDYSFKMLYVLAIFMIIDGHIGSFDYLSLNGLLSYQNYHIALFMFASGYFLNLTHTPKEYIKKKFLRLIVPLYVWNFIYGLISAYLNKYHGFSLGFELNLKNLLIAPLTDGHQFIYNMASWFLVPLFLVQIISFFILKPFAPKLPKFLSALFFILAFTLGSIALAAAPANHGARNFTLTALRTFYFLPSYALGFFYRHTLKKYDTLNTPAYIIIILTLTTIFISAFPGYNHIPSWLDNINAPALAVYAVSFSAIFFWLRIAKILTPIIQQSPSLQYIANHTFDLMMHHFAGFMLIKAAFSYSKDFNLERFKSDIWYYPFPFNETLTAWVYISITIVIALSIGFTSQKIYAKLLKILNCKAARFGSLNGGKE